MTDIERALSAFLAADVEAFSGLPAGLRLSDLEHLLAFDRSDLRHGETGSPGGARIWLAAETATYHGGLRLWVDEDGERVVLLEGLNPLDDDGGPAMAPDLGEPDGVFDAVLGPLHVADAERVYADRGLAVQVYAGTGVLVGVLGFAPTTIEDYRSRLQPHHQVIRPLAEGVRR
jgi:hypothetical protein